jgi:hypothetical protein
MAMRSVAYAVVHQNPPDVYLATDIDVLQRVLVLNLVCRSDPADLGPTLTAAMRSALLEERWADAVVDWIEHTGIYIDVYTNLHVFDDEDLPDELVGAQLQFTPLFRD